MRLFVLVLCSLTFALAPVASSSSEPCHVPDFVPGTTRIDAAPDERVRVRFEVTTSATATYWGAVAWHEAVSGSEPTSLGFSAERAAAILFLEDAEGALVEPPAGFLMYPYGIQANLADATLRITVQDNDTCGAVALGTEHALAPGTYTLTVLAGSDTANGGAALLPKAVQIIDVERGPSRVVSESSLACDIKARASALGVATGALVGCAQTLAAEGRAYHGVFSGRYPDATHEVRWTPPEGPSRKLVFFDGAIEPAGAATLQVPKYVTAASHPFLLPGPSHGAISSDAGIFGVWADV